MLVRRTRRTCAALLVAAAAVLATPASAPASSTGVEQARTAVQDAADQHAELQEQAAAALAALQAATGRLGELRAGVDRARAGLVLAGRTEQEYQERLTVHRRTMGRRASEMYMQSAPPAVVSFDTSLRLYANPASAAMLQLAMERRADRDEAELRELVALTKEAQEARRDRRAALTRIADLEQQVLESSADVAVEAQRRAAALQAGLARLNDALGQQAVAEQIALQERERLAAAARAAEFARLPASSLSSVRGLTAGLNGLLPDSALCWVGIGQHRMRCDAAASFRLMAAQYQADRGEAICITDSYRTYAEQVDVFARKPHLAAVPGTSNHGWGIAVDLCGGIQTFGSAAHQWMQTYAHAFGWRHPAWARQGGGKPEAWHWEYGT